MNSKRVAHELMLMARQLASIQKTAATKFEKVGNVKVYYDTVMRFPLTPEEHRVLVKELLKKNRGIKMLVLNGRFTQRRGGMIMVSGTFASMKDGGKFQAFVKDESKARIVMFEVEVTDEEEALSEEARAMVEEFGEEKADETCTTLGHTLEDVKNFQSPAQHGVGDYSLDIGGEEYIGFNSYEAVEEAAKESVKNNIKKVGGDFGDWIFDFIDEDKAEKLFRSIYQEWDESYAKNIMTESSSEGYANRLVDELVQWGIVSEEKAIEEDYDGEADIDEFVESLVDSKIEEGLSGYEHYSNNFGAKEAMDLALSKGLIDEDAVAQHAVDTDGPANELSYDGSEYEVDGTFWYQTK